MGLQRAFKEQRARLPVTVPALNLQNLSGDGLLESTPSPKAPKMRLAMVPELNLPSPEKQLEAEAGQATARTSAVLAGFEDFWGDSADTPREEPDAIRLNTPRKVQEPGAIRLSTPRKSQEPLKIFKVCTPRASTHQKSEAMSEKRSFVPPWPYGSQWPYNCAPTTLELRGLPRGCTAEVVIAQLDSWGFKGKYDFVYVPACSNSMDVAVVNAARHADGCALASLLHGCSDWKGLATRDSGKRKTCRVSWSFSFQGYDSLVWSCCRNDAACWCDSNGQYMGPWIYQCHFWAPLFHIMLAPWPETVPEQLVAAPQATEAATNAAKKVATKATSKEPLLLVGSSAGDDDAWPALPQKA